MNLYRIVKNRWESIPLAIKVSTAYVICSILQRCLSFITMPLFTRLLTKEQYGQYTVYGSWQGIFNIILTLNLAYGSFSTAMVKFEDRRDEYIASIEGICLLLTGAFLVIYLPFRFFWNQILELPTYLVLLMMGEILCSTAILLWSGKKRFEFKYKSVVIQTLLVSVAAPVVAFLLVQSTEEKGYARIFGYALTTVIIGGFFFFFNLWKGKRLYDHQFWKYAFGFNIPLLAYYLSQIIFIQSDRIMISRINGMDKAAVYGVAYNLAMILNFVLTAINNSYIPWFYQKIKEGKTEKNKQVSLAIAGLMAILLLAVIWLAPEIIRVMAGEQYMSAVWVVPPVAMSLLLMFYTQLFTNVEFYYEEKTALVWASIGAALVNIILNAWLIPIFGFVAAGYTTLASYIILTISNYVVTKRVLKQKGIVIDAYDLRKLTGIFVLFAAAGFLGMAMYGLTMVRMSIIAVTGIVVLLNWKKLISNTWKSIRRA